MPEFSKQVLLAVIDKAVLGGVLLGLGYFFNRRIEVFKARRALEGEFLRERTKRLDELHSLMLELPTAATAFVAEADKQIRWRKSPINLGLPFAEQAAEKRLNQVSAKLASTAARSQPWIGDDLAALIGEYTNVVHESVAEETVAGSHDIDLIQKLLERAGALRDAVAQAIREGAPEPLVKSVSQRG